MICVRCSAEFVQVGRGPRRMACYACQPAKTLRALRPDSSACKDCGATFVPLGRRGRNRQVCYECKPAERPVYLLECRACGSHFVSGYWRKRYCSAECSQAMKEWLKRVPCAGGCGRLILRGDGSLPAGEATCRACRARRRPKRAPRHVPDLCQGGCGKAVGLDSGRRWKYCSDECGRKARKERGYSWTAPKRSSTARGYGPEHRKLREKLLPEAYGKPCPLCGFIMDESEPLHLDHTDDRTGYRGMVHASCNIRDGAKRGAKAVNLRLAG
jgi:hypothetical protein